MTSGDIALLAAVAASVFNLALQYYSQVSTYPLFAHLPDGVFAPYHHAYEQHLVAAIYLPFVLLITTGLWLVFDCPAGLGWGAPLAMLAANALTAPISALVAVPTHRRLATLGHADAPGMRRLLFANALRLFVAAIATAIGMGLLATVR